MHEKVTFLVTTTLHIASTNMAGDATLATAEVEQL
jgi:hypothetical protein